jgi:hypothetical protein
MKRNKKRDYLSILLLLVVGLSIGYALLQTTLTINGTSKIKGNTWDIHFANLHVTDGSVAIGTGDSAAVIQSTNTDITYTVTLNEPGDFYEFTVDAVNAGTIDGMIESVTSKLNNNPITTLPAYLNYSVTYSDGVALSPNQYLKAGDSETYKVRIEFKKDISSSDLPTTVQTLTLDFGVVYVQADDNAIKVGHAESFADDDWDIVINTLKTGNISPYEVGDEKEVDLGTFGKHKLRIANSTTPEECSTEGFSQTACGVVLEFVDIITTHRMNPFISGNTTTIGLNSKGGWEYSDMRAFLNSTTFAYENIDYSTTGIYSSLPEVIKNAIIDTTVVSGHNSNDTTNFTTTDKLYLLSTHEVWEDVDGDTNAGIDKNDTSYYNTRQLDYYKGLNVTTSNYSNAIKKNGTSNYYWWMRSPRFYYLTSAFYVVNNIGGWNNSYENDGVSPAFRIA